MWCPCPEPIRRRALPLPSGLVALVGLAGWTIAGCSSPSRGPETDIVEVERIEIVPTETDAHPPASPPPVGSGKGVDNRDAKAGRPTGGDPAATGSDDASRPAPEEVPAAPAAD